MNEQATDHAYGVEELDNGDLAVIGVMSRHSGGLVYFRDIALMRLDPAGNLSPCGYVQAAELVVKEASFVPRDTSILASSSDLEFQKSAIAPQEIALTSDLKCSNWNQPPLNISCDQAVNRILFFKQYFNRLRWQNNSANKEYSIVRYRIYRSPQFDLSQSLLLGSSDAARMEFVDGPVDSGTQYYYSVVSVDSEGRESPKSPPVLSGK